MPLAAVIGAVVTGLTTALLRVAWPWQLLRCCARSVTNHSEVASQRLRNPCDHRLNDRLRIMMLRDTALGDRRRVAH